MTGRRKDTVQADPKIAGPKPESDFDRFKDLTQKLLRVPKREVDAKRKKG